LKDERGDRRKRREIREVAKKEGEERDKGEEKG